ncbi:MAG: hypothetical protein Q8Q40_10765 [Methylococcaceae bacterium]|nr:hypothetical protein [Methylococcaceae bacterium]MDP3904443.1 hypothetical protein [Methylococcaceae bacterium]
MTNKHKHLWQVAQSRINNIDWELPVTEAEVNALYEALPERLAHESIQNWCSRVLTDEIDSGSTPIATSYITRRAASDGKLIERITLESDDSKFRLSIARTEAQIHVKAEALGLAIEEYAHKHLQITCNALAKRYKVDIGLDDMAEGEAQVAVTADSSLLFFSPDTRIIINVL